jgi:hypothetical protein
MISLLVHEILQKVSAMESAESKTAFLKQHDSLELRDVLRGSFDDCIQWNLPLGKPTYDGRLSKSGHSSSSLRLKIKIFHYFVKGGQGDAMKPAKRENMFLQILETIHPKDADMILAMKDKKLETLYPGITRDLVKQTWPGLILK